MALRKGFGVSGSGATAEDFRRGIQGAFVRNANGSLRAGVLGQVGNIVTAKASMGVDVAAFQAVLAQSAGGALPVQNDGTVPVSLSAAPSSNSRIDVVYVKHNDATGSDADSLPVIAAVTGTAAASPVKPSIPAGALELATVLVPAGATTTQSSGVVVTQTFAMTAAAGGVVPFRSQAELDAWSTPTVGQFAYLIDSDRYAIRRASAWLITHGYAEFTTQINGLVNGSETTSGTITLDASKTVGNPTSGTVTGGVTLPPGGVYLVQWHASLGSTATGRCFVELRSGSTTLARTPIPAGQSEDAATVQTSVIATTAAVSVQTRVLKTTAATPSNVTGRLTVMRIV